MRPTDAFVNPMLTDLYELTMAYAYWKNSRQNDPAVFDLFFRKNPFGGEFTIFAGLEEALRFVSEYRFRDADIDYLRSAMPACEKEFFTWLQGVDCSGIKLYSLAEGSLAFPPIPLIRVEGPLAAAQLLETTLLNLVNFASLVATNAARFRLAAGADKMLMEFGLRRAQGPDGGISASRYSYVGGFNSTSNVLAGQLFGIPISGTHAHSFVSSYSELAEVAAGELRDSASELGSGFVQEVSRARDQLGFANTNQGELAAFISYARAFPKAFLALVDTYDTLKSGLPNFLAVAAALHRHGYQPIGVRLDSGDLAYLSKAARRMFRDAARRLSLEYFADLTIVASHDINEQVLLSLNQQGHEIDVFGIGTHLATCQAQPALGCVYKLVEINGKSRIKISEEIGKVTIPGRKAAFRLIDAAGSPIADILTRDGEAELPRAGKRIQCRHPFVDTKRAYVTPDAVVPLYRCVWDGKIVGALPTLHAIQAYVLEQLAAMREDHLRPLNPTPYKVSLSDELYRYMHQLWQREASITEIS